MFRTLAVVLVVAAIAPAATAADQTGFAFGRSGGNIVPFTVLIATNGTVKSTGPVKTRTTPVPRLQIGKLNQLVVSLDFEHLPKATNCHGTLPDVAATFIRVGREIVRVHGSCVRSYQQLWTALERAAGLRY